MTILYLRYITGGILIIHIVTLK